MKVKKVFVVFKTHFDLGYTHLARELVQWYGSGMARGAAGTCQATSNYPEHRKYVWTIPAWPFTRMIEGIGDKEFRSEIEELIQKGQLLWHALPFTTHTEFCGLEEWIRGLYIAGRLSERYGRQAASAKMTDVPGHTWMLPSILAKAGIRFLHLGSNSCAMPPEVPRIFLWEGPDGGRVLTYYSRGEYGTDLVPPGDWEYPYWLAMLQTPDNTGAQDIQYLDALFNRAERELPGVDLLIGSLDDFADAMLGSDLQFPVVRGDLADTWIRGVGSAPAAVSRVRSQRSLLAGLESVSTLTRLLGASDADIHAQYSRITASAYENMLLFGEHTWSLDTKVTILPERRYGNPWIGFKFWENGVYDRSLFHTLKDSDPGYIRLRQSWREQVEYLGNANEGIHSLQRDAMQRLASSVDMEGERLVVSGHLGWKTKVELDIESVPDAEMKVFTDCETGTELPVFINQEGKRCIAVELPALGYKTLAVSPGMRAAAGHAGIASVRGGDGILDNGILRVEVEGASGCVRSLYSKVSQTEWVHSGSDPGFGQYIYDIYGSQELNDYLRSYSYVLRDWGVNDYGKAGYPKDQMHERFTPKGFSLTAENGFNWGKITATAYMCDRSTEWYGNAKKIVVSMILYSGKEYLDIRYDLYDKQETPLIESGHFAFPLAIKHSRYRINKMGCVVDPEKDIIDGCNKDLHCLDKWVDIHNGNHGVTVISLDMPLFSFDTPGVLKYDRDFTIQSPTLLMQAYNNAWGTNFPQWIGGNLTYRYRLIPYEGNKGAAEIFRWAEEAAAVPVTGYAPEKSAECSLPAALDILPEGLDGFGVLAYKYAEDRNGYILRVKDTTGIQRTAHIKINKQVKIKEVWVCDLVERKKGKVLFDEDGGQYIIPVSTRPYEIHTYCFI